ncbi:alpha/beta fold hydrolase [Cyclobacterium qasimii]|uniref:Beta-ketoadipate enol-lactone hydrolase n=2 Tax=Cyclobacterium qasimii TaxID=1350429 RepID=S7V974_9BACT|nr:alpha/beta hydrolase [Cyclobacterium qasimii]EPR66770.1 Beta-ketoadipate enol-lactone hydrolase [Cyclobacterium qasimii M12-11B]GEO21662.1 lipase [Cyclobacterium qasimii]
MKKIFKIIAVVVLLIFASGAIVFFFFPEILVDQTNASYANSANLEKKTVEVNGYTVYYYENEAGNKPDLVLLHGMGDDKSSFLQTAKFLTDDYHLILPDLAGHGENERQQGLDYSIDGQATFLRSFLEEIGVSNFNLIGNSMGGHTAAAYAVKYPEDVSNLILLNAAGITLDEHIVYGGFGKEIESIDELNAVLSRVFYQVPEIPGPIANYMIEQINNSKDFVDGTLIPSIKSGKYFDLKNEVQTIKANTLVLWGKHDGVVKFNVAEYYRDSIPKSELKLIENASHSPQLEVPETVANEVLKFINSENGI